MPVWQYSTHKAPKHHMAADEMPGHKWEFVKRTDILTPPGNRHIQYQARCSCGWKAINSWLPFRRARATWDHHMTAAQQQQRMTI